MDREKLIERKYYDPMWADKQYDVYAKDVLFKNTMGTWDRSRLPMKSFVTHALNLNRAPQSKMRLNVWQSRYHHPSGLTYDKRDFARVLNSTPKPAPGYINQEISQNSGYFGHGY